MVYVNLPEGCLWGLIHCWIKILAPFLCKVEKKEKKYAWDWAIQNGTTSKKYKQCQELRNFIAKWNPPEIAYFHSSKPAESCLQANILVSRCVVPSPHFFDQQSNQEKGLELKATFRSNTNGCIKTISVFWTQVPLSYMSMVSNLRTSWTFPKCENIAASITFGFRMFLSENTHYVENSMWNWNVSGVSYHLWNLSFLSLYVSAVYHDTHPPTVSLSWRCLLASCGMLTSWCHLQWDCRFCWKWVCLKMGTPPTGRSNGENDAQPLFRLHGRCSKSGAKRWYSAITQNDFKFWNSYI